MVLTGCGWRGCKRLGKKRDDGIGGVCSFFVEQAPEELVKRLGASRFASSLA